MSIASSGEIIPLEPPELLVGLVLLALFTLLVVLLGLLLLQVGFTEPVSRLTAGELLPHHSTLTGTLFDNRDQAVCFCGTILGVTPTGRYPAPCPAELGLSSRAAFRHLPLRSSSLLTSISFFRIHIITSPGSSVKDCGKTPVEGCAIYYPYTAVFFTSSNSP